MNQPHFFEKLYPELAFSTASPAPRKTTSSHNSSQSTHLVLTNLSSGRTLEGSFYLENNLLMYYYQGETVRLPEVVLDVSYARVHTIFWCDGKSTAPRIHLTKDRNSYEILFDDKNAYDDWMLELREVCILRNFEKKYQIAEVVEKKGDISECVLEAKMGGNHYSAKRFDKKRITAPENSLKMVRLMNEIEILRALKIKRVLKLIEVYETEDSLYLVTDLVHKITLKKVLKAPFSASKTKHIMQQILKVLTQMKAKNITHRNLKPSSILIEDRQNIRITNFGLATYINAPKANIGICGTPGYIAPEILNCYNESRVYDDKVDVFSAGCIFYEMLFGKPLFESSNVSEVSTLNKNFNYSKLAQFITKEQNSSTKLGLDLLLKLLHNDPTQRISAEEALADIYFEPQESFSPNSTPRRLQGRLSSISRKYSQKKITFDISPKNSSSPGTSFSEAVSSQDNSTVYLSNNSLKKLPEENCGKCLFPSNFKNLPKFKSAEEMKLPTSPKRLNDKIVSETFILQKIDFSQQNEEDSEEIFDESSPLALPKNYPITSADPKKHPSQRV